MNCAECGNLAEVVIGKTPYCKKCAIEWARKFIKSLQGKNDKAKE